MNKEHGLALLVILAFGWVVMANIGRSEALERAETLEAAIPAIAAQRDSVQQRADSLVALAASSDSVVAELRADLAVQDTVVRTQLVTQLDTILSLVPDTTLILRRDSLWQSMVDARDSIIVQQDSSIAFWRASSFAKDTVIWRWEQQDSIRSAVNDELRSAIRRKSLQSWGERVLAVGAIVLLTR